MIKGVVIKKLAIHKDKRGLLMEFLRNDEPIFKKFGQVYMTLVKKGMVKAWHFHKKQDDHFCCIAGLMRLALYDARPKSKTYKEVNDFELGLDNPQVVKIPKGVYHGFKCVSQEEAIVINVPTYPYNPAKPDEYRIDAFDNDIPYDWRK